jgi:exonuclease III
MQRQPLNILKQEMTVGTLNITSLYMEGRLEMFRQDMKKYRYDIIGLQEVRFPGQGCLEDLIYSNRTLEQDPHHNHGVGIFMSKRAQNALLGYSYVAGFENRLMAATFKASPRNFKVIVAYAPHHGLPEEETIAFYSKLSTLIDSTPAHCEMVVLGDFNCKVGKETAGFEEVTGKYGLGMADDHGFKLLETAQAQ